MHKIVGYFDGTDPLWLTALEVQGFSTLPMSNGYDSHGLSVQQLDAERSVDLLMCYFHKLVPPQAAGTSTKDMLHFATVNEIPVLAACPAELHQVAAGIADLPANVELVDPATMLARVQQILQAVKTSAA